MKKVRITIDTVVAEEGLTLAAERAIQSFIATEQGRMPLPQVHHQNVKVEELPLGIDDCPIMDTDQIMEDG